MISVLIIGAGPAGMMAAVSAAEAGASVTLLERNPFP
ncbi:MAG: FAD-dependent oxidoreductase, partial [Clostridia bacterium]|nr:FAD-dependent oxidoreductase [Clostridia bacterium]